ncbi:hypothetical protein V6N13_046233 [Hibiscus sabdariffa]
MAMPRMVVMIRVMPQPQARRCRSILQRILPLLIVFGDFNATLTAVDRFGCAHSSKLSTAFQNHLFDYGLRDMGYQGPDYM